MWQGVSSKWFWLAVAVAMLGACGLEPLSDDMLVENRCTDDTDCLDGTCDPEAGMCVTASTEPLRLALEVSPATDGNSLFQFGPFDVDGTATRTLELPIRVTVVGTVRAPAIEGPVRAAVHFTRKDTFPGRSAPRFETTTLREPTEVRGVGEVDFSVGLVAEQSYDVVVQPLEEHATILPPLRTEITVPRGGVNSIYAVPEATFVYPESLPRLQGIVATQDGEPVTERQVRAVNPLSGRVVSSTAVIRGEDGRFELSLVPGAGPWVLRISPLVQDDPRGPQPTFEVDPAYLIEDEEGVTRILVPSPEPVEYVGAVEPKGSPGTPVVGAHVTLRSVEVSDEATGVGLSYSAEVATDDMGRFRAAVFPGTYDVMVTPPAPERAGGDASADQVGVLTERVPIIRPESGNVLRGQLFELPRRPILGGEVRTPDRRIMQGATVEAKALGWLLEDQPASRLNRSNTTTTDASGLFRLPLDIGAYDLFIRPPSDSGFAWIVQPGREFGSSARVSEVFEFSAPVALGGRVLSGMDRTPVPGAEIRAWAIMDADSGSPRAIPVGRATSREDGSYTLLLPPRL